jgi:dephospho-CoA kinase
MPSLALTGNIGSGKTSALDLLVSLLGESGIPVLRYSADEENRQLLESNPEVKSLIIALLGPESYTEEGAPNRELIFRAITRDPETKIKLEEILHPRLEAIWKPLAKAHRSPSDIFFVAEIPLLYEKDLVRFFDKVLVVGCSDAPRKGRLLNSRSVKPEMADEWMSLQHPQDDKISKADHLLWNDGSIDSLKRQIQTFLHSLTTS